MAKMDEKDVSSTSIISGVGFVACFFYELIEAVRERGGTDKDLHRLVLPEGRDIIGKIAELVVPPPLVWRVVTLGLYSDVLAYRAAFTEKGVVVSRAAEDILRNTTLLREPTKVKLVFVTLRELGLYGPQRYGTVCDVALRRGLDYCLAETGLALRIDYTDQPPGERLIIIMKPFSYSGSSTSVFLVGHFDGFQRLSTRYGDPADVVGEDEVLIFQLREE